MNTWSYVFLGFLALGLGVQVWLSLRQQSHVARHRAKVPEAFADSISLAQHQKAADYTQAHIAHDRYGLALSTLILLGWTFGGGLHWLHETWLLSGWSPVWSGVGLILSVTLIGTVLELPLSLRATFGIEARFGFNKTTPAQFVKDFGLGLVLSLLIGVPLLAVILWLMVSAGRYWWIAAWAVWMGFMLFMVWAYPTLIAPLFNKFVPLEDKGLRERLESLLQRCGFSSDGMFVMDGSKRSAHGNAYFTGFGRNKRIVFYDTLLKGLEPTEVEAVLAHELGHFKRKHIRKQMMANAALSFGALALLGWLVDQTWFYQGLGVYAQSPALALILFMLALPAFTILLQPLFSSLSRRHEFEADDYAAEQADARDLISGLVKMYRDNASTLTPDPLYSAFHHSHPPAPVRISHLSTKLSAQPA